MEESQPTRTDRLDPLVAALQHPNEFVRAGAALALGRERNLGAIEFLIPVLGDPVFGVHTSAARALGALGAPAIPAILSVIQEIPFDDAHTRAAVALQNIRDPMAVPRLCEISHFPDGKTRAGAIDALGAIGDSRAVDDLIAASRHIDPTTRRHALSALGNIGDPAATQAAIAALGESDWRLREAAINALAKFDGVQVVEPILVALQDEVLNVRIRAAAAIRQLHNPMVGEALIQGLGSQSAWVRANVAEALGGFGNPDNIESLRSLVVDDTDLVVQINAAQSLAMLGDARGEGFLLRTLNAPNASTRQLAAVALGNLGDPRAVGHLLSSGGMRGGDSNTPQGRYQRQRVIAALVRVGTPAIPPLIDHLDHPNAWVCDASAQALEGIGAQAIPPLVEALKSNRRVRVRQFAAQILGRIGKVPEVEVLTGTLLLPHQAGFWARRIGNVLVDRGADLRKFSAESLGLIGLPEAAPPLLLAAQFDPDREVRTRAQKALAAVGDRGTILQLAAPNLPGLARNLASQLAVLAFAGLLLGVTVALVGHESLTWLGGLLLGGGVGAADGLVGEKRPYQGMFAGSLLATGVGCFGSLMLQLPGQGLDYLVRGGAGIFGGGGFLFGLLVSRPLAANPRLAGFPDRFISGLSACMGGLAGVFGGGMFGFLIINIIAPTSIGLRGETGLQPSWGAAFVLICLFLISGTALAFLAGIPTLVGLVTLSLAGEWSAMEGGAGGWLAALVLLPSLGAILGWRKSSLAGHLTGMFVGMVVGFLSAGLGGILAGIIIP